MSLDQVTLFNIKRDIPENQVFYGLTALIAIAGIVFSTQMFRIAALQGMNHHIVLGGSLALLGIEALVLMKRNVTKHYRVGYDSIKEIMQPWQHCAIINVLTGKKVYLERYTKESQASINGSEFSYELSSLSSNNCCNQPVNHQAMLVLGKTDKEIESLIKDGDWFKANLQKHLQIDEFCTYKNELYSLNGKIEAPGSKQAVHLYVLLGRFRNGNPVKNV